MFSSFSLSVSQYPCTLYTVHFGYEMSFAVFVCVRMAILWRYLISYKWHNNQKTTSNSITVQAVRLNGLNGFVSASIWISKGPNVYLSLCVFVFIVSRILSCCRQAKTCDAEAFCLIYLIAWGYILTITLCYKLILICVFRHEMESKWKLKCLSRTV